MAGLNKVMLIGNLGADPEMRYTANGNAVTTFNVAVNRNYSGPDGERKEETEWFTVVTWNKLAETCSQFLQKGRRAYVEGRLHSHSYQGNDGQTRFSNEIIADRVLFLDRAGTGEREQPSDEPADAGATAAEPQPPEQTSADDLPF